MNTPYLEPCLSATGGTAKRNKKRRLYSEGWLEFQRKKIAKQVAASLNNAPIGGTVATAVFVFKNMRIIAFSIKRLTGNH